METKKALRATWKSQGEMSKTMPAGYFFLRPALKETQQRDFAKKTQEIRDHKNGLTPFVDPNSLSGVCPFKNKLKGDIGGGTSTAPQAPDLRHGFVMATSLLGVHGA